MRKVFNLLLIGIGLIFTSIASAVPPHYVILTWNSGSIGITETYNIWKQTGSCSASRIGFIKINTVPVTITSFIDTDVAALTSYCYYATAIVAGVESIPSQTVEALIPADILLLSPVVFAPTIGSMKTK